MQNYLDKLSLLANDNDELNSLSNDENSRLHALLYAYTPFVIMTMNHRNTGKLDMDAVKQCIIYLFKASEGSADIKQICIIVLENIDNLAADSKTLTNVIQSILKKYTNK